MKTDQNLIEQIKEELHSFYKKDYDKVVAKAIEGGDAVGGLGEIIVFSDIEGLRKINEAISDMISESGFCTTVSETGGAVRETKVEELIPSMAYTRLKLPFLADLIFVVEDVLSEGEFHFEPASGIDKLALKLVVKPVFERVEHFKDK